MKHLKMKFLALATSCLLLPLTTDAMVSFSHEPQQTFLEKANLTKKGVIENLQAQGFMSVVENYATHPERIEKLHDLIMKGDGQALGIELEKIPRDFYGDVGKAYYLRYGKFITDDMFNRNLYLLKGAVQSSGKQHFIDDSSLHESLKDFVTSIQELINAKLPINIDQWGTLDLSQKKINSLDGFQNLPNFSLVSHLIISMNKLKNIDDLISPTLRILSADNNEINTMNMPNLAQNLPALTALSLTGNPITTLENMTPLPPNLSTLFLSRTQIRSISKPIIQRLNQLALFWAEDLKDEQGNPIQLDMETQINLRDIMGDRAHFDKDPQLKELD